VPTLIIHGRNDAGVPLTHSEDAASKIPECTLISLENTDHLVWLGEKRTTVKDSILEFSNRVKTSAPVVEYLQKPEPSLPSLPDPFAGQDERSSGSFIGSKIRNKQISKANIKNESLIDELYDL
jgi:hypothetical protein